MAARHDKTLSKRLSWLLRHGAEREGLQLLPGGFLPVSAVLVLPALRRYTVASVRQVVADDDKQRFCLRDDPQHGLLIRANQGHSLQVEELELEKIASGEDFPVVVHGTYYKCLSAIKKQGLSRMNRQHIHLASGLPGQGGVISGMRSSCQVHVHINIDKAIADGVQFYKSANGVILTPGDSEGLLRPKYFTKIVDARTDTNPLQGIPIDKVLNHFAELGKVVDFRFKKTTEGALAVGSSVFVEFETKSSASAAVARGLVLAGTTVQLTPPPGLGTVPTHQSATGFTAEPMKTSCKRKPQRSEPPDPLDHEALRATMSQMKSTHATDDLMRWLSDQLLLTPAEHRQRMRLCGDLQTAIRARFRTCLVQAFGSSVSGLGFRGCDLDMYAYIDASGPHCRLPADASDADKVNVVASLLKGEHDMCRQLICIKHARVPIIKFRSPRLGWRQCDMSFRNPLSCQNSRLIAWFMQADQRALLVAVAVRYWAKRRHVAGGDHNPNKMSSYCLTLLVIAFLQQLEPPVLPSVAWSQAQVPELMIDVWNAAFLSSSLQRPDSQWRSTSVSSAADLLRDFFRHYAAFESDKLVVCPLVDRSVSRDVLALRDACAPPELRRYCQLVSSGTVQPLSMEAPLVVQDPFELNHNVARAFRLEALQRFVDCCRRADGMPFVELFNEQPLGKLRAKKKPAAVEVGTSSLSAVSGKRERQVSGGSSAGESQSKQAKSSHEPPSIQPTGIQCQSNGDGPVKLRPEAASCGRNATEVVRNSLVSPAGGATSGDSMGSVSPPVSGAVALRENAGLLERVLEDFGVPPTRVVSVPLRVVGSGAAERRRGARALARLLHDVFERVLLFDTTAMSFAGLDVHLDVLMGWQCRARRATWEFRRACSVRMAGRAVRDVDFEVTVTERVLTKLSPEQASKPLAEFTCYLVLDGGSANLCLYEGVTSKEGKNCHLFVASFVQDMSKRIDYCRAYNVEDAMRV